MKFTELLMLYITGSKV